MYFSEASSPPTDGSWSAQSDSLLAGSFKSKEEVRKVFLRWYDRMQSSKNAEASYTSTARTRQSTGGKSTGRNTFSTSYPKTSSDADQSIGVTSWLFRGLFSVIVLASAASAAIYRDEAVLTLERLQMKLFGRRKTTMRKQWWVSMVNSVSRLVALWSRQIGAVLLEFVKLSLFILNGAAASLSEAFFNNLHIMNSLFRFKPLEKQHASKGSSAASGGRRTKRQQRGKNELSVISSPTVMTESSQDMEVVPKNNSAALPGSNTQSEEEVLFATRLEEIAKLSENFVACSGSSETRPAKGVHSKRVGNSPISVVRRPSSGEEAEVCNVSQLQPVADEEVSAFNYIDGAFIEELDHGWEEAVRGKAKHSKPIVPPRRVPTRVSAPNAAHKISTTVISPAVALNSTPTKVQTLQQPKKSNQVVSTESNVESSQPRAENAVVGATESVITTEERELANADKTNEKNVVAPILTSNTHSVAKRKKNPTNASNIPLSAPVPVSAGSHHTHVVTRQHTRSVPLDSTGHGKERRVRGRDKATKGGASAASTSGASATTSANDFGERSASAPLPPPMYNQQLMYGAPGVMGPWMGDLGEIDMQYMVYPPWEEFSDQYYYYPAAGYGSPDPRIFDYSVGAQYVMADGSVSPYGTPSMSMMSVPVLIPPTHMSAIDLSTQSPAAQMSPTEHKRLIDAIRAQV